MLNSLLFYLKVRITPKMKKIKMKSILKYIFAINLILYFSCSKKVVQERAISSSENEVTSKSQIAPENNNEIVIEGTVISSNRGFYQNTIYSSCVVEVNKIFQGNINERIIEIIVMGGSLGDISVSISHGQIILPSEKSTAIFRIKELAKEKYHQEFIELTPFKLFYGRGQPISIFPKLSQRYDRKNIEKEIYQKLESESGRKRNNLFLPATNDIDAISYSMKNKLLIPNRKKGLVYRLTPVIDTKKEDKIGFHVHMASTNSVSYLQKGELIIEYNSLVFGDSIVSKGKLEYEIPRNFDKGNSAKYNAIPEHFEVSLEDLTTNKFKIEWENTLGIDSCLQLFPEKRGIFSATLYFSPIEKEELTNLKLIGIDSANLQYDYEQKKVTPFEYTATQDIRPYQAQYLMPATVTNVIPNKVFQLLDTMILEGKNLMAMSKISLCSTGKDAQFGYEEIPKSHIINKNDSLITLVVPYSVLNVDCGNLMRDCFSVKGKVKITKGYGQFEVMTWSEKSIEIRKTSPFKD